MAGKSQRRRPARGDQSAPQEIESRDLLEALVEGLTACLVALRLLVPPEGSVLGRTLWITQFWFAAGLLHAWLRFRRTESRVRLDLLDWGVWLIVAAHVVSALRVVIFRDGHSRAAINMLWEWLALGVSFPMLREILGRAAARRQWTAAMVGLAVAASCYGMWQHYVWYPSESARYDAMRGELDRLESGLGGVSDGFSRAERIRELRTEFARQQIPMEGPARRLWEDRLRGSREPIGLFALANTFSGWLTVWLILGGGVLAVSLRGQLPRGGPIALGVSLAVISFCLVLTKSRTAWVGLMAGVGVVAWNVGAERIRQRRVNTAPTETGTRRWTLTIAGVVLAVISAVFVAGVSGGFDRQVISEAPKSLRYRLQYWHGAAAIVREHPWLGVGPGNFRPHYLKHKLPESSEEIADPHNFLLDLWTSGGILAVIGLCIAAWGAVAASHHASVREEPDGTVVDTGGGPVAAGVTAAFGLVLAADWVLGSDWADLGRLVALFAGWLAWMRLVGPVVRRVEPPTACLAAAILAMLVHLLGAGGIEMPGIVQTLLLLVAFWSPRGAVSSVAPHASEAAAPIRAIAWGVANSVLFVACLLTATVPVAKREAFLAEGDVAMSRGAGEIPYGRAALADPFSPDPPERLSESLLRRGLAGSDVGALKKAADVQKLAVELDPHNAQRYRRLGEINTTAYEKSHDAAFAAAAVEAFAEAVARYPNFAPLRAEYADALQKAGLVEAFRREAARALQLDDINRREGHADKILPDDVRARLSPTSAKK